MRIPTLTSSLRFIKSSRLDAGKPGSLSNLERSRRCQQCTQVRPEEDQAIPVGAGRRGEAGVRILMASKGQEGSVPRFMFSVVNGILEPLCADHGYRGETWERRGVGVPSGGGYLGVSSSCCLVQEGPFSTCKTVV